MTWLNSVKTIKSAHWFWSSGRNVGLLGWLDDLYFEHWSAAKRFKSHPTVWINLCFRFMLKQHIKNCSSEFEHNRLKIDRNMAFMFKFWVNIGIFPKHNLKCILIDCMSNNYYKTCCIFWCEVFFVVGFVCLLLMVVVLFLFFYYYYLFCCFFVFWDM